MALTKVTGQVIKNTTDVTVGVLTVTNTLAVGGTVSIGGTLTYEDVTNIDSVGLITARDGISVTGGNVTITGGGSFVGDGSQLTGVASTDNIRTNTNATFLQNINVSGTSTIGGDVNIADKIVHIGDTNTAIRFPEADTFSVETSGTQRLRAEAAGNVNFANNINVSGTSTVTGIAQFANTINLTHASAGQNYIYFNEDLQLAKNGTGTRLKINSDGSVGIGTVTAGFAKLDVIDGIINVGSAVTTHDSRIQFTRKDTGIYSWMGIPTWNPNALYIYGPKDSNPYAEAAALYESSTWQLLTSGIARVQINPTGSLNIRNTSGYTTYDVDISNAATTDTSVQIRPNDGNAGEAQLYMGGGGVNQNKCALIFDPAGGYCRGSLHICMDNTADTSNVDSGDKALSISSQGYITKPSNPSFMAYGDASWTTLTDGQSVHPYNFNNIAHNIGGHYKNSGSDAGKFIAPVAGVYQLNWNIFCQGLTDSDTGNTLEFYVRINGSSISRLHNKKGYGNMGDDQQVVNLAVAEQLSANDEVTLYAAAYGATWRIYGGHTTFSGYLVQ